MRSDQEILAIVCRAIIENTIDPPTVDANTKFSDLKYKPTKNLENNKQILKRSAAENLMYPILNEFTGINAGNHYWIYPDSFSWEKSYKKVVTVQDVCIIIRDGYLKYEKSILQKKAEELQKENLKEKLANVRLLEEHEILNDNPSWEEVQKFFLEEEFHEEHRLVTAIKTYLLTDKQKKALYKKDLSIEDMLNGRYVGTSEKFVYKILDEWNEKLGFKY